MRIVTVVLWSVLVVAEAATQERKEVSADSYDVYSALLTQRYKSWFRERARVLIYPYTVPTFQNHESVAEGCRTQVAQKATEGHLLDKLISDQQQQRIASKLKLPGPYTVLKGKVKIREGHEPGIVYLSAVAFSENRRAAMVWLSNGCGGLCGGGYL
jgi:hypothetical protein